MSKTSPVSMFSSPIPNMLQVTDALKMMIRNVVSNNDPIAVSTHGKGFFAFASKVDVFHVGTEEVTAEMGTFNDASRTRMRQVFFEKTSWHHFFAREWT